MQVVEIGYESGFSLMSDVNQYLTWLNNQGLAIHNDFEYKVIQSERKIRFEFKSDSVATYFKLKFS